MTKLDWSKADMPAPSDAIPRAPVPPQVIYDEKVRDNSDPKKQADLKQELASGEWFEAPAEFRSAWKKNAYPFKLAGFQVNKSGATWFVSVQEIVERQPAAKGHPKAVSKKQARLSPSNRHRPF
jgi:hypothetical protein